MHQQYKPIKWYIFAVVIGILSLLAIDKLGLFEGINNYFYDLSFRIRGPLKPDERIIIIAIDEKTLEQLGRWPLNRIYYAQLIDLMKEASAVGLNIIVGEPTEDDPELSAAMARHGKVILPVS
jgi:CHASE2 domain-containing sensor protein